MTVDNLPDLHPPDFGSVQDRRRPILSFAWQADGPHRAASHSHPRGHIIFTESGSCWVDTPEGRWLVPHGHAIWIPPHLHHEVYGHGPVTARVIFVDPAYVAGMPSRCGTVAVGSLLVELILRTLEYGNDYPPDGAGARLAQVMLDELASLELSPVLLPVSRDTRLTRAMERLARDPASKAGLTEVARDVGASPRTLARLFRHETGLTFAQWRTRLRLVESIERLAKGESVTEVALDLGYASTSSFVFMFRSNLGVPPGRYVKKERSTGEWTTRPR
jgi:AraC-like DNA-binding protein